MLARYIGISATQNRRHLKQFCQGMHLAQVNEVPVPIFTREKEVSIPDEGDGRGNCEQKCEKLYDPCGGHAWLADLEQGQQPSDPRLSYSPDIASLV
jgi:hypothetical protein